MGRDLYARMLWHTGLWRLVDRIMPKRLLILAGHCVADKECNGCLPPDMKLDGARLEGWLGKLGRRYRLVSVQDGVAGLAESGQSRSMVALSMDDGYRDNHKALLPILERTGASATVYLESRPLLERKLSWSHKYFWLLAEGGYDADRLGRQYLNLCESTDTAERLRRVLEEGGDLHYQVKRVFKYEAAAEERNVILDKLFTEAGGDEQALCERIYMSSEHALALAAAGVELGGHTARHEVQSTLSAEEQAADVGQGRDELVALLGHHVGHSFAYPFGRRWDWNEDTVRAVGEAGFLAAVTTHAGVNVLGADPMRLKRWMVDDATPFHHLMAEACGGFQLLRRFGLDLSE
ncbi:MAG: peptidoglycan/xylan/chitin deacetylase (PgdA/CDA1 family) [Planctomycetota bacterium]|jgi:peptidoglycan/xylan/chitin deacetylase (PgdA/CDA1 family)